MYGGGSGKKGHKKRIFRLESEIFFIVDYTRGIKRRFQKNLPFHV